MSKELQYKLWAFITTAIIIVGSLVLVILFSQGYKFTRQKTCLYIDLKKIYSQMKEDYKLQNISDQKLALALNDQKLRLQVELRLLEQENIIFLSHRPLAGAKDYTEELYTRLMGKAVK